jgi:hypothetical protein
MKKQGRFSQVFQDMKNIQYEKSCEETGVDLRPEKTFTVRDTDQVVTLQQSLINRFLQ